MAEPSTFCRVYPFGDGLEHPATTAAVSNVIRSMHENRDSDVPVPFRVRLRMDDGSVVILSPKKGARRG